MRRVPSKVIREITASRVGDTFLYSAYGRNVLKAPRSERRGVVSVSTSALGVKADKGKVTGRGKVMHPCLSAYCPGGRRCAVACTWSGGRRGLPDGEFQSENVPNF